MDDNENGWIKLHRKFLDWQWYDDQIAKAVFLDLLLSANHESKKWRGIEVKRGQHISSYQILANRLNFSIQQVRSAINRLKSTGEITHKPHPKFGLFTINNYDAYQKNNSQVNSQATVKQQSSNSQVTTNKNDKNYKNDKNNNPLPPKEGSESFKKLKKWLGEMEDVKNPNALTQFYFSKYPENVIEKALKNAACVSRAKFSVLCEFYSKK